MYKNAYVSIISLSILLTIAIISIFNYQNWQKDYQDGILSDIENKQVYLEHIKVEEIIGNILYMKSPGITNLESLRILDEKNSILCNLSTLEEYKNSNLISYWDFNADCSNSTFVCDKSLNNHNLTYYNFTTSYSGMNLNGKFRESWDFQGNVYYADYLRTNGADNCIYSNLSCGNKTISIWFNARNITSTYMGIISTHYSPQSGSERGGWSLSISKNDKKLYFSLVNDSVQNIQIKSQHPIEYNKWYHAVITANDRAIYLYLNGILQDYKISTNSFFDSSRNQQKNDIYVGSFPYHWYYGFDGMIDEIRIYNKTLSSHEIRMLNYHPVNNINEGIKEINISKCNLRKGNKYKIVGFTNNHKIEQEVIKK